MEKTKPQLPVLYDLVTVEKADSARAYAERLAMKGAEEGTFVWVKKQTEGIGRKGNFWISGHNNLHCSIILRLNEPFDVCCQLSLVTSVAVAQAITIVGEPMEELRVGWPNDIYLNRGKVAGVQLSGELDHSGRVKWMVVSLNINTFDHPTSFGFAAASLRSEGFENYDNILLAEYFAREFLSWSNRWAEQGLGPIKKAWLWRGDWTDDQHSLNYQNKEFSGHFQSMDDDGRLILTTNSGKLEFALNEFFKPDFVVKT